MSRATSPELPSLEAPPIVIDTVILAAGQNTRLRGLVPTAHKPLITMNGETLIGRLGRQVRDSRLHHRTVVVANPLNVGPLTEVVPDAMFILQPEPTGPVNALRLGINCVSPESTHIMLLCADNYMSTVTLDCARQAAMERPHSLVIGAREVSGPNARRFTRLVPDIAVFVDANHGPPCPEDFTMNCWIGPVIVPKLALGCALVTEHLSFAGLFNHMLSGTYTHGIAQIPSDAQDVGVPEELMMMEQRA